MVAVAQLVESRIVIPVVVGSNPISHPNSSMYVPDTSVTTAAPNRYAAAGNTIPGRSNFTQH